MLATAEVAHLLHADPDTVRQWAKALQIHLGHGSMLVTMRYLSIPHQEDALRIQQQVVSGR